MFSQISRDVETGPLTEGFLKKRTNLASYPHTYSLPKKNTSRKWRNASETSDFLSDLSAAVVQVDVLSFN